METSPPEPSRTKLFLAFAAIYLLWGSTYLAIRLAIDTLPPFLMAGSRFLVAGAALYLFASRSGSPRPSPRQWRNAAFASVPLFVMGNGGVTWAEREVPSGAAALVIARENAAAHGVAERIEFVEGDLLASLPPEPRFTVIASNPPYVSEAEYAALPPQVRNHEPKSALLAGPTGTEVVERLIPQAAERLMAGGWLILEVSPMIAGRVVELIAADGHFDPPIVTKDLAGQPRVVNARRRSVDE